MKALMDECFQELRIRQAELESDRPLLGIAEAQALRVVRDALLKNHVVGCSARDADPGGNSERLGAALLSGHVPSLLANAESESLLQA